MKQILLALIFVFILYGCQSDDSGSSSSDPVATPPTGDATADATTDTSPVAPVDTPVTVNTLRPSIIGKIELGKIELGK
jgi:hypothetical protein